MRAGTAVEVVDIKAVSVVDAAVKFVTASRVRVESRLIAHDSFVGVG